MATQPLYHPTEEEYLARERAASECSEYVDGEVFEMPGGTPRHANLIGKWATALNNLLRGTGHYVLPNARLRTPVSGSFVYPDVSVFVGAPQTYAASRDNLLNPILIIEVLSPSTEDYDHGKKFAL